MNSWAHELNKHLDLIGNFYFEGKSKDWILIVLDNGIIGISVPSVYLMVQNNAEIYGQKIAYLLPSLELWGQRKIIFSEAIFFLNLANFWDFNIKQALIVTLVYEDNQLQYTVKMFNINVPVNTFWHFARCWKTF